MGLFGKKDAMYDGKPATINGKRVSQKKLNKMLKNKRLYIKETTMHFNESQEMQDHLKELGRTGGDSWHLEEE